MPRSPLHLAALACAAVPGLDPVTVEGVVVHPGDEYQTAFVDDSQERRWVVRVPRTMAAGAMLDDVNALAAMLARRLEVGVPLVRGQAEVPEGNAAVYPRLPGRPLDFAALPDGPLAADVGRVLAHVHNVERALFEEAGRPSYDAEGHRHRQLSELDRAAATGHVPTGLLTRWESRLEDVSLWRFAPTPVHGELVGSNVLASFDDEHDASTGRVRALLAWEQARVGDPADDFADLVLQAPAEALDDVLAAYAQSRIERPDRGLLARARLAAEMAPMRILLRSMAAGERELIEWSAARLRSLDESIRASDDERATVAAEESRVADVQREAADDADEETAADAVAADSEEAADSEGAADGEGAADSQPAWDATQPHQPFPHPGATQVITAMIDDNEREADEADARDETREQDEDDTEAVVDLHEGASDFIDVPRHRG